jgi:hypothetical protein
VHSPQLVADDNAKKKFFANLTGLLAAGQSPEQITQALATLQPALDPVYRRSRIRRMRSSR